MARDDWRVEVDFDERGRGKRKIVRGLPSYDPPMRVCMFHASVPEDVVKEVMGLLAERLERRR